ncbi:hypothetical protein EMIHUDRAFT_463001 [Emiliania huxleyi CCMP1516]|uniref:Uncharacterized protein n=2 Tax=Emiliania huxleyi TaxID=2903 RepID=A0A0D3K0H6_EMIH1|nr:hypothetical protein EMIHUDRAFT_463001 [Emiliania huxleyi CCMP1516]EOD29261.1 hypothetical protein EMIHUDRAFT_463001 [Emiliania huxleyi CCMP1516]|eukprot:XP_005781690.1 hypothetical protein EMIHUDRAFT_463001 [Emiliania huxleyi CCMP1516]
MGCCSSRTHHFDADELDKPSSGELDKPSSGELVERLVQQHAAAAANQSEGEVDCWAPIGAGLCPILPLPLSISAVRAALGEGCSDELAAFVEREARREYTEASTAFELVVASVAYDNSGVMHAVNGLLARVVAFVRAVAARKHEEGGGDTEAEAFVEEFMAKTFSTSGRGGGFGAFGSDPEAVRDLLADSSEERLREKTGVVNQEALLLAALEATDAREEGWGVAGGEEEALARQLGIDFAFFCERRAPAASSEDGHGIESIVAQLSSPSIRRALTPLARQLEFRTLASEASQKSATRVHEGTLAALDMGLSPAESTFAARLRAAAPAAAADADAMPWFSGDAAGLPLRASSSGTTFQILTIARYLGVPAEEMPLLRLAAVAFLCPQHHSFLEVMLGASEYCGAGPLAAGADCWQHLLPRDYCFQLPGGGGAVTRDSLNAEIEAEMRGVGDISAAGALSDYAQLLGKYRSAWPAQRLSPDNLRKIAARFQPC